MENENFDKTVNARRVTPTEIAYRDGYVRGQTSPEQQQQNLDRIQQENQKTRESYSATNGLLTGIILAAIIGCGIAAVLFVQQVQKNPTKSAIPTPRVEKETKVIEKTTDRIQELVPSSPPNVQVNIPTPTQQPIIVQPKPPTQPTEAVEQKSQPNAQPTQAKPN